MDRPLDDLVDQPPHPAQLSLVGLLRLLHQAGVRSERTAWEIVVITVRESRPMSEEDHDLPEL